MTAVKEKSILLYGAVSFNDLPTVKKYANELTRLRINGEPYLTLAACNNNVAVMEELLSARANIDLRNTHNENTALIEASCIHHMDVIRFLVENNADVNAANHTGQSALFFAQDVSLIPYLLKNGAAPSLSRRTLHGLSVFDHGWPRDMRDALLNAVEKYGGPRGH
jgi:hypothetical protein